MPSAARPAKNLHGSCQGAVFSKLANTNGVGAVSFVVSSLEAASEEAASDAGAAVVVAAVVAVEERTAAAC